MRFMLELAEKRLEKLREEKRSDYWNDLNYPVYSH